MGAERIVYGDKVINVLNRKVWGYFWDERESREGDVANGEIGIVVSGFKGKLQAEFSTQPKVSYRFNFGGDEAEVPLELAYALTVHKAQGSEFDNVILVISDPCSILSKELIYTAITRQKNKLVILFNTEAFNLRQYSSIVYSDIARRFTNLFKELDIVEIENRFFEANLVNKTANGILVRSKSEVIVANALYNAGIDFEYEKSIDLGEDGIKSPDFTIEDAESGTVFYWEHCGMMSKPSYRRRWENKKAVYEKHGIVEGKNLIVSYDKPDRSIDSQEIQQLIDKYLI